MLTDVIHSTGPSLLSTMRRSWTFFLCSSAGVTISTFFAAISLLVFSFLARNSTSFSVRRLQALMSFVTRIVMGFSIWYVVLLALWLAYIFWNFSSSSPGVSSST